MGCPPRASAEDPWSSIPLDIAGLVLKRLPAHVDRVRFAAVCPQWRSAVRQVKLPPPMPLLALKKAGDVISHKLNTDVHYSDVIKLMVCSPNLIAVLLQGKESNWIAVCRPGGSKWSVAKDLSLWITDMAFYQGKLYVVDYHEELLALDISVDDKTGDPRVSRIGQVINVNQFDNDPTLLRMLDRVESCGSLLLVRRRISRKHVHGDEQIHTFAGQCEPDLSIFEADFARSQWTRVTALADNQALFLGPCSRAVCMPEGDSLGNRVWFLDDYKDFHSWREYRGSLSSDTSSVANPKPFSPLPMISWKGYQGNAGAAWLFPTN